MLSDVRQWTHAEGPTPRQLAREQNIDRIKALALTQLAESGAGSLSLRAIARELNLVSSAIYRYYPSRDELITALIVDAYGDLADHLDEAGAAGRRGPRRRWVDTCLAMRAWAVSQPQRWALIYGSTIPGYAAPPDTIDPAGRVVLALCRPVAESGAAARRPDRRAHPGRAARRDRDRPSSSTSTARPCWP